MFRDVKYLLAYSIPLATLVALIFDGLWSYATVFFAFGLIPLLEIIIADRTTSYSDNELAERKINPFFDWMLYANLPIVFSLLVFGLWDLTVSSYAAYEWIGKMVSLGILLGTNGINVAHELGHRTTAWERNMAKILLCPSLYMHFYIEHNFGHHKNVSTPKDPATAKRNQSVYGFWVQSILGQYISAWRIQLQLLKNQNRSFLSWYNDMLLYLFFQTLYVCSVGFFFGSIGVFYAIGIALVSFLLLETINYIEHYGLERKLLKSGRYERVQAHHSWNSNHVIGRMVLYELTRHSDHHFRANKKYQLLENKPDSPQLPYGYPTSMVLSMLPPLWFRRMDQILDRYQNSNPN